MRLLNEMTPEERRWREQEKRYCVRCGRFARVRVDRHESTVTWTGEQQLPPRRFVNARMRVIEETWLCPGCPKRPESEEPTPGLLMDFEHVGSPEEIVPWTP